MRVGGAVVRGDSRRWKRSELGVGVAECHPALFELLQGSNPMTMYPTTYLATLF